MDIKKELLMIISIEESANKYKDNVFTLSLSICKNITDAEDVNLPTVFIT